MNTTMPNTAGQQHIFDNLLVTSTMENKKTPLLFIQGIGGCGITTWAKRIWQQYEAKVFCA